MKTPESNLARTTQHGEAATEVAPLSNLLYRRFPIGKPSQVQVRSKIRRLRRLQTCDTADCKPALRAGRPRWATALIICSLSVGLTASGSERVKLVRTPDGGIQPQAAVDSHGGIHMIYYKGPAADGDIFYVRQQPGQETFSHPIQVNSQRESAMATGTIRGPQLAVGKNGRVHVVWDGMGKGATQPSIGGKKITPFLYTRLNDAGTAFEPERNLITYAAGLDGGGSVAADNQGNVYAFWHAHKPDNTNFEAGRAVFVARSTDDGKTFAREKLATSKPTGACGCCGMKAFADSQGNVFALYRGASEMTNRDEILLSSRNRGADFEIALEHPWKVGGCTMSSASFSEAKAGVLAAWETYGKIYFARVNPSTLKVSEPVLPPTGRGASIPWPWATHRAKCCWCGRKAPAGPKAGASPGSFTTKPAMPRLKRAGRMASRSGVC